MMKKIRALLTRIPFPMFTRAMFWCELHDCYHLGPWGHIGDFHND